VRVSFAESDAQEARVGVDGSDVQQARVSFNEPAVQEARVSFGETIVQEVPTPSPSARSGAAGAEARGSKKSCVDKLELPCQEMDIRTACTETMPNPWVQIVYCPDKEVMPRKVLPSYCRAIREELCRKILQLFSEHLREELALARDQMPLILQEVRQISAITAVPDPSKLVKYLAETEMHIKQGPQRSRILPDAPLSTHVYRQLQQERRKLAELFNWGVMSKDVREDAILGLFIHGPFTWARLSELVAAAKPSAEYSFDKDRKAQNRLIEWEEDHKALRAAGRLKRDIGGFGNIPWFNRVL